jgi:SPOR domain
LAPVQSPTEPHQVQTVAAPPSTAPDEPAAAAEAVAPAAVTAAPQPASPRPGAPKANQKIASQGEAPDTSQVGQSPVGRYMIQISASAAREEATAVLKAAQAKYPDVLGGQQSQVREKKLADKTPLFTAQFGPFASRAEAAELCQRLKSAGGSCYVP